MSMDFTGETMNFADGKSHTRLWVSIILLALALILDILWGMQVRTRTERTLKKHWTVLLQLEGEATARRGGRPRSPAALEAAPAAGREVR